jgi:2-polyprenyl-3-methyl-5-hydroxy-6-metoxy-1,4-benzoquinol methylase
MTIAQPEIDQAQVGAFAGRVLGDVSACMTTLMAALGDRLGLFKALGALGAATSAELAARAGVSERYTREWLGGMAAAGYVAYEPVAGRFTLPPAHAPALAEEGGPFFVGGPYQLLLAEIGQLGALIEAFKTGGGVPAAAYDASLWEGQERFGSGWVEHLLTQVWLPAMPGVQAGLERGAAVADIGCGRGRALIKLAQAFPNSYFVGYDIFEPVIAQATANAQAAGVADRVRFQHLDATQGLPAQYDLITTFDVIHDAADPLAMARGIRQALKPDGTYLCVEINCSDKLEENAGPLGALFHGISLLYCLPTSLAAGGPGLGTLGLSHPKLQDLCGAAGFGQVRRLPLENPFNSVYEITL